MANKKIREYAKKKGIQHYLIADELDIQESAFSKLLRKELDADKKQQVLSAIDKAYYRKHPEEYPKKRKEKACEDVYDDSLFKELLGEL